MRMDSNWSKQINRTPQVGSLALPDLAQKGSESATSTLKRAMNYFNISEDDIQKVINKGLGYGGEYVDLFFEHTQRNSIGLRDGEVNSCSSTIDYGVGVRVVIGDQTGYAYVEQVALPEMLRAAEMAARIAAGKQQFYSKPFVPIVIPDYYAVEKPWEALSIKEKVPFLQQINRIAFSLDNRVTKVVASLSDTTSHILFCNSDGSAYYDYRPRVAVSVFCVMQDGNRIENGYASRAYQIGFELLSMDFIHELTKEAIRNTALLFQAIKPKGGEMPVVMGAGGSGILLHEAIGHAFEADFNRKNTSIFADKLGKKICSKQITVFDDATIPHNRGALNIDDEGVIGQKTVLVKEGVLNSYLHDRISARYYGVKPTGNGRRESFRSMPIPRMRATYMDSGKYTKEDIISSVDKGIYVDQFTNGQVQIGAGDFTFFVKSGYLIEQGVLTQPIKDVNIIGNGPRALADITMVGNDGVIDNGTWTCGKSGQSCPVTCGMPTALVRKLTVGGIS